MKKAANKLILNYMTSKSVSTAIISAVIVLGFTQCVQQTNVPQQQASVAVSGLKLAYVDVDSLLANYLFYQDLVEEMTRKEENYRLALTEEYNKLQKEINDFQKKVENNVYSSAERAESERNRLLKKQQAFEEKQRQYSVEFDNEGAANSEKISEIVDDYIKKYNQTHGYDMIISKASLLFANEALNITAEVLDGLNSEYKSDNK
ncbi:MAG: OmpH family outer membrane protein [Bacteroidaceae bacterium]|nr:OmpH family outer membrane protein [Bacteroidaceae bacterium]